MIKDTIDKELLERFEAGLNPLNPSLSTIPAEIIGYGEMSTIFVIDDPSQKGLAYKRMPIFRSIEELDQYERLYEEYNTLLGRIGLSVPEFASVRVFPEKGNMVIYNVQERLTANSVCNQLIHRLDSGSINTLFILVLRDLKKVFGFNAGDGHIQLGIDGQISNWAVKDYRENRIIHEHTELFYFDTSTPLMRKNEVEQLNPELFLRSAPSFLVWLVRWLFLEDVMTRYYDFRKVTIDLIANFYKEQRSDLIPLLVDTANNFFTTEAGEFSLSPLTIKEVSAYYREDAMIWRIYLALRKIDRLLHLRILKKPYVYILPGKIKR